MFDNVKSVSAKIGEKEITFTTGQMARQADGAVVAVVGDTQVLVTAVARRDIREGQDFFPLTVDVEERMYAVGRIPGSFFRREGRATEKATLTARLIDRPLRPSFREGFLSETHIVATVMAVDLENPYDVIALNGASAALSSSPIPFEGPVGAVRLGYRNGNWEPFPTYQDLEESVFDLLVAGVKNSQDGIDVIMVEAGATEEAVRLIEGGQPPTDEDAVARGLEEAKDYIRTLIDTQLELRSMVEIDEVEYDSVVPFTDEHVDMINGVLGDRLVPVISLTGKKERGLAQSELKKDVVATIMGDNDDQDFEKSLKKAFDAVAKKTMRNRVVKEGIRLDGRGPTDLRQLDAQIGVLPRAHGSALFTRGETQVLNVTTLGMLRMEQMLDTIDLNESKRYMHHYNFPPFSTGETGFMRGPKRREIGHGALAEKALLPVIPDPVEFPYAFRLVSEVLASNGSSSMASVCGSSLSLMDAGVPISGPVAGIAMGVIAQDGEFVTLTDILGAEDALGDMDFKVAGTAETITAMQLDTKIEGLPSEVLSKALYQAKEARTAILAVMNAAIATPRD
ncbi:MAG: polyribonucleotide nucleotidyltransferase, partial [Acidimicrobiia bacterium]|nr:polyribonucleotide nucleotidyltransferase [Acidimicrobiia bacterium]NNL27361.1 polyribonucleotide nucleotidyltransferase [Acidimicrobiia bacterium]